MDGEAGWTKTRVGKGIVDLGDGLRCPETMDVEAHLPGYDDIQIRLRIVLTEGVYEVDELAIKGTGNTFVRTELLRVIPLRTIVRMSVQWALDHTNKEMKFVFSNADHGDAEERLRRTAFIYRRARLQGVAPTDAVAEEESISRSTASRRVAAARKRMTWQA
jgi:hypothetical protein